MDIYFYCTYEHSASGFFPALLTETGLMPADGSQGVTLPQPVWEFFSFDRFKILWREYPEDDSIRFFPAPAYGMFGIRRIEGNFGDRHGVVNIVVTADREELQELEDMAVAVINDFTGFSSMLLGCMSIGGSCGYSIDAAWFSDCMRRVCTEIDYKEMSAYKGGKMLLNILKRDNGILTQRDLLRFAVSSEPWKNIRQYMGNALIWKKRPKNVITLEEFEKKFVNKGHL